MNNKAKKPLIKPIIDFFNLEAAGGIILIASTLLALILVNTGLAPLYDTLLDMPLAIRIDTFEINKPLVLWINDGLMATFFFLVGLELKREILEGELSNPRQVTLPALGAIGGMVVPAAIYYSLNVNDPEALRGWAIPAATDIAFALGILSLLGKRVPIQIKIFLTSLAIFDDLGAIVIIAFFYTSDISLTALLVAAGCLAILIILNYKHVTETAPYILIGIVLWAALLKSGVHATLAGVILAFFIPLKGKTEDAPSPLKELEHNLHSAVAFGILPLFAFVNSGLSLKGLSFEDMLEPVPLGLALGLFVGKQLGIFSLCWIGVKLGIAQLPDNMNWKSLYGVSILCGVGFTMSLFIGSLAFEGGEASSLHLDKLGIIVGSFISATVGYLFLRLVLPANHSPEDQGEN